jgi:transcriptional regulator with XRE-family HTH domain
MEPTSRVSRKMSWRGQPRRVSVLAEMALRRERIAERLGELRERDSLTQEQAAAKVGVTLRQWQRWEAGESVPYPRNLDAVASRFGITVAEFFDPEEGAVDRVTVLEAKVDELEKKLDAAMAQLGLTDPTELLEQELAEGALRATERGAGTARGGAARRRAVR